MDLILHQPVLVAPEHIAASYLANCDQEAATKSGDLAFDWYDAFDRYCLSMRRQMQSKRESAALVYTPTICYHHSRRRKLVIGLLLAVGGLLLLAWGVS